MSRKSDCQIVEAFDHFYHEYLCEKRKLFEKQFQCMFNLLKEHHKEMLDFMSLYEAKIHQHSSNLSFSHSNPASSSSKSKTNNPQVNFTQPISQISYFKNSDEILVEEESVILSENKQKVNDENLIRNEPKSILKATKRKKQTGWFRDLFRKNIK